MSKNILSLLRYWLGTHISAEGVNDMGLYGQHLGLLIDVLINDIFPGKIKLVGSKFFQDSDFVFGQFDLRHTYFSQNHI